jgi:PEGA domain
VRPASMDDVSNEIIECLKTLGVETPIAEIRPAVPVTTQVRARSAPSSGAGTPAVSGTPRPRGLTPAAMLTTPDGSRGAIPEPQAQVGSGGTRLLSTGAGLADLNVPDLPPIPTTFRETTGESMRRRLSSPQIRSAALMAVVAIGGIGVGAAFMSRTTPRVAEPNNDVASASGSLSSDVTSKPFAGTGRTPQTVTIEVRGLPLGAEVWLDGAPAGELPIRLTRNAQQHTLLLRAGGYEERVIEIDALRNALIDGAMTARASASVGVGAVAARTAPNMGDRTGGRARDVGRIRQAPVAPARPVAPPRKRTTKKADSQPDDPTEENRALRAITDI